MAGRAFAECRPGLPVALDRIRSRPQNATPAVSTLTITGNRPEYDACHESGHAVGFLAQSMPLRYVTISGVDQMPVPHVQPVDPAAGSWGQRALIGASGLIAGFRSSGWSLSRQGVIDLLLGSADDQFELVGLRSGRRVRRPRGPIAAAHQDLSWIDPPQPFGRAGAVIFWAESEQFVVQAGPAIVALAGQLVRHGTISGTEAAAVFTLAMHGLPVLRVPGWAVDSGSAGGGDAEADASAPVIP